MTPAVLPWNNENSLTPFPLVASFGYDSFLTDANFIQFDNFVPTLVSIKLSDAYIDLTLNLDDGLKTFSFLSTDISTPGTWRAIALGNRYIGTLVFGAGVAKVLASKGNQTTIPVNKSFLPHLVKSIPTKAGVYSIDSKYGELTLSSDDYISYDVTGNNVTFKAISLPPEVNDNYLKTLNLVGPENNSVFIKNTDIIKVTGGASVVTVSLVGNAPGGMTQTNSIIVTSDGG